MNLTLTNIDFVSTGIFGTIEDDNDLINLSTLQHAFPITPDSMSSSTTYAPIIPPGTYICVRGEHILKGMDKPFETFCVTGVQGHTNLLFHKGNFNKDSEGCILLGLDRDGCQDILHSALAFDKFMAVQYGLDRFSLTVR